MRYYSATRETSLPTHEDTIQDDEVVVANADAVVRAHKNYDRFSEGVPEGTRFASDYTGVEVVCRRGQPRLAVSYHPALEPLGQKREPFYQHRCWGRRMHARHCILHHRGRRLAFLFRPPGRSY